MPSKHTLPSILTDEFYHQHRCQRGTIKIVKRFSTEPDLLILKNMPEAEEELSAFSALRVVKSNDGGLVPVDPAA